MFEHQDLQMLLSNFHPLEVVGRCSETQLQVTDNLDILCLFYYSDRYNIYKYTIAIIGKNSTVYPAYLWLTRYFCLLV